MGLRDFGMKFGAELWNGIAKWGAEFRSKWRSLQGGMKGGISE